ncbi:hypothetical protein [Membranihabitans marinus]|uniref:hypothetical protein n=1 Tax=Membranihabitans marinus TaxID=1227546 RepID=UPI001F2B1FD0|nr:hypothetical protein [Membranihabitans marinus]
MSIVRIIGLFLFFLPPILIWSQDQSQAYIIKYDLPMQDGLTDISEIKWLTGFNKEGYNNQPFVEGSKIYLTTSSDNGTMDVIALNPTSKTSEEIISTRDYSEFSTSVYQGQLYFVRQSLSDHQQGIWRKSNTEVENISYHSNVAYYRIINQNEVAIILIEDQKLNLYIYNLQTETETLVSKSVGRGLEIGQNSEIYFIHKYNDRDWYIKKYDPETQRTSIVQKTLPTSEDFCLDIEDQKIWMAQGSFIYYMNLQGTENRWKPGFDLSNFSINNIKRIAKYNKNQMVIINH